MSTNSSDYGFLSPEDYLRSIQQGTEPSREISAVNASTTSRERYAKTLQEKVPESIIEPEITHNIITGAEIRTVPHGNETNNNMAEYFRIIQEALARTRQLGRTADIAAAVDDFNINGPLFGIKQLLSSDEQQRLTHADAPLIHKVESLIKRHVLAQDIRFMLQKADTILSSEIAPLLCHIENPDARASVERAMHTWEQNKGNPQRNLYLRSDSDNTPEQQREFPVALHKQNPHFFSVGKAPRNTPSNQVAAWSPGTAVLEMKLNHRPFNWLDGAAIVHEVTHQNQQSNLIGRDDHHEENQNRYMQSARDSGAATHGALEHECEAFANMVEIFIAKLRSMPGNNHTEKVKTLINASHDLDNFGLITELTAVYIDGGGRKGKTYPKAFIDTIRNEYINQRVTLFALDDDGFPVAETQTAQPFSVSMPVPKQVKMIDLYLQGA